jgi:hypothetical protein
LMMDVDYFSAASTTSSTPFSSSAMAAAGSSSSARPAHGLSASHANSTAGLNGLANVLSAGSQTEHPLGPSRGQLTDLALLSLSN